MIIKVFVQYCGYRFYKIFLPFLYKFYLSYYMIKIFSNNQSYTASHIGLIIYIKIGYSKRLNNYSGVIERQNRYHNTSMYLVFERIYLKFTIHKYGIRGFWSCYIVTLFYGDWFIKNGQDSIYYSHWNWSSLIFI